MERDFKGVWIAKEIWLDNKLTWMEKLFITEINSLDKEQGCFASNNYFAKFFQITPGRCSQIINSLIKKGYISAEYFREGKEIKKRVLRILNTPIKNSKEGIKNTKYEYLENDKENNTYINNTNKYYTDEMKKLADYWKTHKSLTNHTEKSLIRNIKRKHFEILTEIGEGQLTQAIFNYATIKQFPEKYWYNWKFTFWRFLEKIDTFLDSADPLNNYKRKDIKQEQAYPYKKL